MGSLSKLKKKFSKLSKDKASRQLPAPMEAVRVEQMTRVAAYDETKKEVQKWAPVVSRMRNQNFTSFPLGEESHKHSSSLSTAALQTKFRPKNDLEQDLESILTTYGYKEKEVFKKEEAQLADRSLTPEEIKERQSEVGKLKALLFANEAKMRRIKKIKSKTFRKLHRKRQERLREKEDGLESLDPEEAAAQAEKMERARILERMSQKHKGTSKWAKQQKRLLKQGMQESVPPSPICALSLRLLCFNCFCCQ